MVVDGGMEREMLREAGRWELPVFVMWWRLRQLQATIDKREITASGSCDLYVSQASSRDLT
jgi:hypothetical protein